MLNYKYWIFGDRRFLISRKRTNNLRDLVTKWCLSMIRASFDWANDPTSIMIAQAAQEYNDKELAKEISYEALQARFNQPCIHGGGRDAIDGFGHGLRQLTPGKAWNNSNTQRSASGS